MTTLSLRTTIIAPRAASWTVAVAGLGYAGLPLALAFSRKIKTIGYDRCLSKIAAFLRSEYPTGVRQRNGGREHEARRHGP